MTNCQVLKWFLERKQILILIINYLCCEKMADKYDIFTLQAKNTFKDLFV